MIQGIHKLLFCLGKRNSPFIVCMFSKFVSYCYKMTSTSDNVINDMRWGPRVTSVFPRGGRGRPKITDKTVGKIVLIFQCAISTTATWSMHCGIWSSLFCQRACIDSEHNTRNIESSIESDTGWLLPPVVTKVEWILVDFLKCHKESVYICVLYMYNVAWEKS